MYVDLDLSSAAWLPARLAAWLVFVLAMLMMTIGHCLRSDQNTDAFTDITVGSNKVGRGGEKLAYGTETVVFWGRFFLQKPITFQDRLGTNGEGDRHRDGVFSQVGTAPLAGIL